MLLVTMYVLFLRCSCLLKIVICNAGYHVIYLSFLFLIDLTWALTDILSKFLVS